MIYTNSGLPLSHENFINSRYESDYPYKDIKVGAGISKEGADARWLIMATGVLSHGKLRLQHGFSAGYRRLRGYGKTPDIPHSAGTGRQQGRNF